MSAPVLASRRRWLLDQFRRGASPGVYGALDELTAESLRTLLPVTTVIAWLWSVAVILALPAHTLSAYGVLAVTVASAVVSSQWQTRNLRLAVLTYVVGLLLTVTLIAGVFRTTESFCLFVLVVLVTAALTGARAVWLVTLVCATLIVALGLMGGIDVFRLAAPLIVVGLATLAAWLSARRLFTALEWALNMTAESQRNAAESQKHRGDVQRVLKNLDEGYVRLEHTNEALLFAQEAAEKAYRFKSDFVANVSHELRTPLNLIIGFSEMMATAPESYGGVRLPREYRGDITAIYRSAKHLSELINDVLDLSQIEAGRMPINKELTDLSGVVREACDIVRGLVEARGLRLEVMIPGDLPLIRLDRTRIRQVLLNLLTNATRFTDHGFIRARVGVHVSQTTADQAEVTVAVEDSGRGIPPDKLARAFEAFTQLHEDQIRDGTGLGLAVSKRFITLHGGRMWIESQAGQGTSVGFALPVADTQVAASRFSMLQRLGDEQPIVLVLHDDPRALTLLQRYVEGYQFVMARTPQRAREEMRCNPPIALIADAAWLDRHPGTLDELGLPKTMPVLKASLPGLRRSGLLLGAVDYLSKPVTREALAQALGRLPRPPVKVVIVDDDPHVVRLLGRMLRTEIPDVQVFEAFGGLAGLQIAREQKPDAMMLDLLMPKVSGYDVLDMLSRDKTIAQLPVIIVSARGVDDEAAPLDGDVRVSRADGFKTTDMLRLVGASLSGVTGLAH